MKFDRFRKKRRTHTTHKKPSSISKPIVSIILLDWSCREHFNTLDWLARQDVARKQYELIWIELYDRVAPEVMSGADTVITCGQRGLYHKHIGYNVGLLEARGQIIVICDSDAVFPPDFVSSILKMFQIENEENMRSLVLMHHERRTSFRYPKTLSSTEELKESKWNWWPVVPNAGACMSVLKKDAIRLGGFDEHRAYKGYLCGPYELGWRMVNAGIPEIWHKLTTSLWHFAHPDPVGTNNIKPSIKMLLENRYPHVDLHAIFAVNAFSTGRILPLVECPKIFKVRMASRVIGTVFEAKYAHMTGQKGFSKAHLIRLQIQLYFQIFIKATPNFMCLKKRKTQALKNLRHLLGNRKYNQLKICWFYIFGDSRNTHHPRLIFSINKYNIVKFNKLFFAIPKPLGPINLFDTKDYQRREIIRERSLRKLIFEVSLKNIPRNS